MFDDKTKEIEIAKSKGLDLHYLTYTNYDNCWQLEEIRLGLEENLDVKVYAKPVYTWAQMHEIRLGLISGIDVSWYLDKRFSYRQMKLIRMGLEQNFDVSQYADTKYTTIDMEDIYNKLCQSK